MFEGANAEGLLDALGRLRDAQLAAGRHDPGRDPQSSRELLVGQQAGDRGVGIDGLGFWYAAIRHGRVIDPTGDGYPYDHSCPLDQDGYGPGRSPVGRRSFSGRRAGWPPAVGCPWE
jgi:hypothetical protein